MKLSNLHAWLTSKRRWLLMLVASLLLAAGLARYWLAAPVPQPFATAPVSRGDIEETVLATGKIGAIKLVSVGAQVTGQVIALHVALGDTVTQGQLIAEIDALPQQNALRNAQAQVQSVQAQLRGRQAALTQLMLAAQRQAELVIGGAGAPADLEAARASVQSAQAEIAALQAQSRQASIAESTAQLNLSYTRVTAPMDGVVVAVVTEQGQTVNANQSAPTIIKLARLDTMTVKAQVSEADVTRVQAGMRVYFSLLGEPGLRITAQLRSVEPGPTTIASATDGGAVPGAGGSGAIYYNAIFDVANPDGRLRIDMTAQTAIVLASASGALTIPSAALGGIARDGLDSVTVLGRDGRQERRLVRVGIKNRVQAQVLQGLSEGELVVLGQLAKVQQ